jgi:nucleoside-diphosphate-sugar epimerase
MRVLVAGASGAIGRRLLLALAQAGHEVAAITRHQPRLREIEALGARPLVCDVFDADRVRTVLGEIGPDAVINELTSLPQRVKPRSLADYYAANDHVRREGTRNLLDAAMRTNVRRLVSQSVAFWYAPTDGPIKSEDDALYLDAPHPIGAAVETIKWVEDQTRGASGLDGVVLRYGFVYGPGTWYSREGDVGRQVRQWRYPIIGKGQGLFSFIHIDDAARVTVDALERASPGIYNVVDDEPAGSREWLPVFAKALGAPPPLPVPAAIARLAAGKAPIAWMETLRGASNTKVKAELAWQPLYPSWRTGFQTLSQSRGSS